MMGGMRSGRDGNLSEPEGDKQAAENLRRTLYERMRRTILSRKGALNLSLAV
jgi:hypothetical protein